MKSSAPGKRIWQVYDHCAAISRLYALYESAVCEIIELYISLLPRVSVNYHSLHERVRYKHRTGIGHILGKWSESSPLYSHLAERDITAGIADGLRTLPYTLLPDAFLVDRENFWAAVINKLFSNLGFENAFAWVSSNSTMIEFLENNLSNSYTAESFLNEFIGYRNEAAHQTPSSIASIRTIDNYCTFTYLLLESLSDLLRGDLLKKGLTTGATTIIGKIMHRFSNNIFGVEAARNIQVEVGNRIYAGTRRLDLSTVLSLRIGQANYENISLTLGQQFGMKLSSPVPLNSLIYRWNL